ncbi:MAG: hydrogenase maturation protease [Anaerolineae bacterium]
MKTIILGLGNPILGDDGVGWRVAQWLQDQLSACGEPFVEVDCASLGGLSLMERMIGYERVILVDAMATGQRPVGSVQVIPLEALPNPSAGHSTSAHDVSLLTALQTAKAMGLPIPQIVEVVAIETDRVYDFCEELSPVIAAAVPLACQRVLNLLEKERI